MTDKEKLIALLEGFNITPAGQGNVVIIDHTCAGVDDETNREFTFPYAAFLFSNSGAFVKVGVYA